MIFLIEYCLKLRFHFTHSLVKIYNDFAYVLQLFHLNKKILIIKKFTSNDKESCGLV